MTQRRPHWDADLCNAVYDAALKAYDDGLDGGAYDTLPIIAVVEDWVLSQPIFALHVSRRARRLGREAGVVMTQRRPHWDDELIDDVFRLMDRYAAGVFRGEKNHGTPTYDIIAAVEDWQARRLGASAEQLNRIADWQWMKVSIPLWHWAQAEAAIQRVRQLCQSAIDESYLTDASIARAGLANRILRALDGAS